MKTALSLIAVLLFATPVFTQEAELRARVAAQLALKSVEDSIVSDLLARSEIKPPAKPKPLTYEQGCAESLATGKPLVVYVGQTSKAVAGSVVCEAASLPGYPAKCLVHCRPEDGVMLWTRTVGEEVRATPGTFLQARPAQYSAQDDCAT